MTYESKMTLTQERVPLPQRIIYFLRRCINWLTSNISIYTLPVKVKVPLDLTKYHLRLTEHHTIKAYGGVKV
jgi:hypothetical protein